MTIAANGPGDVTLGPEDRVAAIADVKALLRITTNGEDALIAAFAETALSLAERFTGRVEAAGLGREPGADRVGAALHLAVTGA